MLVIQFLFCFLFFCFYVHLELYLWLLFVFSGTSYEVQLFAGASLEEIPKRRRMVQMSLRFYEKLPKELPPSPKVVLQKAYIFSDKPLTVSAKLDKGVYSQGDEMQLTLSIQRKDKQPHGIRKIKVVAFQQVSTE